MVCMMRKVKDALKTHTYAARNQSLKKDFNKKTKTNNNNTGRF